jgi:peptide/nickel transport system substrate-binding protein
MGLLLMAAALIMEFIDSFLGMMYGMPKPKYLLYVHYGPLAKQAIAQTRHELDGSQLWSPESWEMLRTKNSYSRAWYSDFPWACFSDPATPAVVLNNDVSPLGMKDVIPAGGGRDKIEEIIQEEMRHIRGNKIAMIFQDPLTP